MKIVAIILTSNEQLHLARCINSLIDVVDEIVVVDCFSIDSTVSIARNLGARVIQHEWVNYATQFNWALAQLDSDSEWILRIDADEFLTSQLASEIRMKLPALKRDVEGVIFGRRMTFQGQLIRHGGVFPVKVLRLFRYGKGECENRWMDEHIKVAGSTVEFAGEMIDDNLNSLTWWIEKHNKYACREVVDLLNLEFGFMPHDSVASIVSGNQAGAKRWLKERVYAYLPSGLRAFAYFLYRYALCLGFLDGAAGASFHILQGFWYRYLVDAKLVEVKLYMRKNDTDVKSAIREVLGIII